MSRFAPRFRHPWRLAAAFALAFAVAFLSVEFIAPRLAQVRSRVNPKTKRTKVSPARTRQQVNADGSITGQWWTGEDGIRETTAEIMLRERARQLSPQKLREREPDEEHEWPNREHLPQHPGALPGAQWPPLAEDKETRGQGDKGTGRQGEGEVFPLSPTPLVPLSPSPMLSFTAATLADTNAFPPDTMGAVGPSQFLAVLNGRIRVFDKATGAKGALDADSDEFFSSVRGSDITTDPRVRYDRLSGRWFVLMINVTASNNRVMLAVSDGAAITAQTAWTFFYFHQNQVAPEGDAGCFTDYPSLGIDATSLYVGVNQFCNRTYSNSAAFVIRKSSALGSGPIVAAAFRDLVDGNPSTGANGIFAPVGVDNFDAASSASGTEGYFIGTEANGFGQLVLRRVSYPNNAPVMSPNIYFNVLRTANPITVRHRGNSNSANGRLDALDDRLFAAVYRSGKLGGSIWTAHNIAVDHTGSAEGARTRNGSRWYEIANVNTSSPVMAQAGTLYDATDDNSEDRLNYWMPSMTVSGQGHALMGFSMAGTNEFVNAGAAARFAADPLGALQSPVRITNSQTAYNPPANLGTTSGRRRWGDYSYTSVDPCDDMTMWTIQQFCDATNSYGLRVAKIPAPPPATPAGASPPAIAAGEASVDVTITGLSLNGSGFYDPIDRGAGFNCRLRATISGGVTVRGVSYVNPTTVTLNVSTANAGAGLKSVTIVNPDGQSITGANILTVGNCSYTATADNQSFPASGGTATISVSTIPPTAVGGSLKSNLQSPGNSSTIPPTGVGGSLKSNLQSPGNSSTIPPTAIGGSLKSNLPRSREGTAHGVDRPDLNHPPTPVGGIQENPPLPVGRTLTIPQLPLGGFADLAQNACGWTAVSNASFITITAGSTGSGDGAVTFTVAQNYGPARTGAITVAGQTITISQNAGSGCGVTLTPASKQIPAAGGSGSFNVAAPAECNWTATPSDSFINIVLGNAGRGVGTVSYTVAENKSPIARTGVINVSGSPFTITQEAAPLELAVDDGSFEIPAGLPQGGTSYRVNRLTPLSYPATLSAVAIYFPSAGGVRAGDSLTVMYGRNPGGGANINNIEFQTVPATVQAVGQFNVFAVPETTIAQGDFVVGMRITHNEGVLPVPFDSTPPARARSYRSLDGKTFTRTEDLGAAGNYGIRARLVRPAKLLIAAASAIEIESCPPANRAIDPGETVTVNFSLRNDGVMATGDLIASLQSDAGVIAAEQSQSYGAIAPGAAAVSRPFTFTATSGCGAAFNVRLNLKDGEADLGAVAFRFTLGAQAASGRTVSYTGGALSIPDGDARGVSIPLFVSGVPTGIADLNFRIDGTQCTSAQDATTVGVTHSWVGDLVFKLTSPAGTSVTIINRAGGGGNGGNNFCQTLLDDEAASGVSISAAPSSSAPYTGAYKPTNPLSAFDGENPNGTWTLTAIDEFAGDSGSVRAFSLLITGFVCCAGGAYEADAAPRPNGNGAISATDVVQIGRFVAGLDAPSSGGEFQRADCAPRETSGDGKIDLADWVQAGRYVSGVDALQIAGGPSAPSAGLRIADCGLRKEGCGPNVFSIQSVMQARTSDSARNPQSAIRILLDSRGGEEAASFSLNFDPSRWRFVSAESVRGGALIVNSLHAARGRLGVVIALPPSANVRAGRREILIVRFAPVGGGKMRGVGAEFVDWPVARQVREANRAP